MNAEALRFVIHWHRTGRSHYDLRVELNGVLRSWSLLKEPPLREGERRLAIERESFSLDSIDSTSYEEEAFGLGRVSAWDRGEVRIDFASAKLLRVTFEGGKLFGQYEFKRMLWYPGNRWLLTKMRTGSSGFRTKLDTISIKP
jgi:DNA ligase D-like protein (predicted 3'-phosphoesterase)